MTPGWAERKVQDLEFFVFLHGDDVPVCESKDVLQALKAEHRRALRVVKAKQSNAVHELKIALDGENTHAEAAFGRGYLSACADILAALQKGRT